LLDVPDAGTDGDVAEIAHGRGDRLDAREVRALAPAHETVGRLDSHEQPRPITPHAGEQMGLDLTDPERVCR
jgi:hypothetical protein